MTAANTGEVVLEWIAGAKPRLGKQSLVRSLWSGDDQEFAVVEQAAGQVIGFIDGVADEVRAGVFGDNYLSA